MVSRLPKRRRYPQLDVEEILGGEPLFYVRLETTDPSTIVRLVEAEKTEELESYMKQITDVTNFVNQSFQLISTPYTGWILDECQPDRFCAPKWLWPLSMFLAAVSE